jgi:hypothetical protein
MEPFLPAPCSEPPGDLSFGVGGIKFLRIESIAPEQAGSVGPNWNDGWLVVARETTCGGKSYGGSCIGGCLKQMHTRIVAVVDWCPALLCWSLAPISCCRDICGSVLERKDWRFGWGVVGGGRESAKTGTSENWNA